VCVCACVRACVRVCVCVPATMSLEEWWYAVCTYEAPSEEQLSIVVGETVQLIDDSDSEWWYAMCPRTELSGYIPALFIEVRTYPHARTYAAQLPDTHPPQPNNSQRKLGSRASTRSRTARCRAYPPTLRL
jgi:hypothetical protein